MSSVVPNVRKELKRNSNKKVKESGQRFFKEKIKLYGVPSAQVKKIAQKNFAEIKDLDTTKIFDLCEQLWKSGYLEESFVACDWSYKVRKKYTKADFLRFEYWVNSHISNWASCDTFCNHTVGSFIETYPEYIKELKRWAKSKNRWMRRAAAVSLIIPAKQGMFLRDIFEIAKMLLKDQDDMVQKGYGWMLKVASQAHQKEVFNFVIQYKKEMPRTALRYAIEKMPKQLKNEAMK